MILSNILFELDGTLIDSKVGITRSIQYALYHKAFEALDEALSIAKDENGFISLILTSMWAGVIHASDCNFDKTLCSFQLAWEKSF